MNSAQKAKIKPARQKKKHAAGLQKRGLTDSGLGAAATDPPLSIEDKPQIGSRRTQPLPAADFSGPPWPEGVRPSFDHAFLSKLCREASDIHSQLSLAYAMAITFRRAVRDFIPPDEQDILPCLSVGVIDAVDGLLPRLDTLLEHLTRALYGPDPVGDGRSF